MKKVHGINLKSSVISTHFKLGEVDIKHMSLLTVWMVLVGMQTEKVLRQALSVQAKPVVMINKVECALLELKVNK